ncbi:MAG: uroporphyrinogen decarboxylase family protein, partial [Thermodesulfobacteriota bacterium]
MKNRQMTPMERVMTTLAFNEPDRVPFFLMLTMHGARALGMSIRKYFSKPEYVVEGQLRLQKRYGHDCLNGFFYAPLEVEAWGGEVIYSENGPPNAGRPIISDPESIARIEPPAAAKNPCLEKVLAAIRGLKTASRGEVPIIGVVMSPFSLPVMQMGF